MVADDYRGVLGAVPYAIRASESVLFRGYAAISGLLVLGLALLFGAAVVVLVADTAAAAGGSLTLSRAFFVVVGLLVIGPLLAPTLLVARRHRHGTTTRQADAELGAAGFCVVASLYVALLIGSPAAFERVPDGLFATVVATLYALPRVAAVLPPLVATAVVVAAAWTTRA